MNATNRSVRAALDKALERAALARNKSIAAAEARNVAAKIADGVTTLPPILMADEKLLHELTKARHAAAITAKVVAELDATHSLAVHLKAILGIAEELSDLTMSLEIHERPGATRRATRYKVMLNKIHLYRCFY